MQHNVSRFIMGTKPTITTQIKGKNKTLILPLTLPRTPTNLMAHISRLRLSFLMGPHLQNTAKKIYYLKFNNWQPSDTPTSLYMPTKQKRSNHHLHRAPRLIMRTTPIFHNRDLKHQC